MTEFEDDIEVLGVIYYVRADVEKVEGQRASDFEPGIAEGWTVEDIRVQLFDEWYTVKKFGELPTSVSFSVESKTYRKIVEAIIAKEVGK